MTTIWRSLSLGLLGIAAAAGSARGAEAPLLVAVEAAPGANLGAAEVRHLIATELGTPVVDAREPAAANAADVLFVTVDVHEIRMSLRAGTTSVVSRTIAAPADRPGRLRSIAWLAGNLVRDQVGPIVTSAAVPPPTAVAETRPPTQPPALPVSPPPRSEDGGPAAVVASRPSGTPDEIRHSPWSITASGGPAASLSAGIYGEQTGVIRGTSYLVDVQHQSSPGSALLGVGVETGPDEPAHYAGASAFIGSAWRRRWWFLEASLGLGLEVLEGRVETVTVTNNSSQLAPVSETKVTIEPVPALFARMAGIAGVRVARDFDLVARLGGHVSSSWQRGSFLSSTVGVRLRLP
jgi:hypothetical protein